MMTSRRSDVATLRRRDVGSLVDFSLLTRRCDVGTSRSWNVATLMPVFLMFFLFSSKLPKTTLFTCKSQKTLEIIFWATMRLFKCKIN